MIRREKVEKNKETQISEALLKVALGFQVAEVTEEYAEVDGALKLTKRKRTKKDVPPDLKAVQLLLAETGGTGYATMSDEELVKERERLLAELRAKTETAEQTTRGKKKSKKTEGQKKETTKSDGGQDASGRIRTE